MATPLTGWKGAGGGAIAGGSGGGGYGGAGEFGGGGGGGGGASVGGVSQRTPQSSQSWPYSQLSEKAGPELVAAPSSQAKGVFSAQSLKQTYGMGGTNGGRGGRLGGRGGGGDGAGGGHGGSGAAGGAGGGGSGLRIGVETKRSLARRSLNLSVPLAIDKSTGTVSTSSSTPPC